MHGGRRAGVEALRVEIGGESISAGAGRWALGARAREELQPTRSAAVHGDSLVRWRSGAPIVSAKMPFVLVPATIHDGALPRHPRRARRLGTHSAGSSRLAG